MRVQQLFAQQVPAHLLQPGRVNGRNATPKQPGGLHQFGTDNPSPRFFLQMRTRMTVKLDAPCAQVNVFLFGAIAQVAQQACEHRQMQLFVAGRFAVEFPAMLGHHGVQLCVHIAPFPQAAWVDEILTQQCFILPIGQAVAVRASSAVMDPAPQTQVATELAFFVLELGMRLVGLGLLRQRAVAHILHAQGRSDDEHLVQGLPVARFQNHAAHAGV